MLFALEGKGQKTAAKAEPKREPAKRPARARREAEARRLTAVPRKLIAFDDETMTALTQLGRDRMATIQDLADEAFADLLKKHGVPIDLKDALKKSAAQAKRK